MQYTSNLFDTSEQEPVRKRRTAEDGDNNSNHALLDSHDAWTTDDYSLPRSAKIYTCAVLGCGFICHKINDHKLHLTTHGDDYKPISAESNGTFLCTTCDAPFKREPDLQRHIRSLHSGIKPYCCPKGCGKLFARKDALKRHLSSKLSSKCAGLRKGLHSNI